MSKEGMPSGPLAAMPVGLGAAWSSQRSLAAAPPAATGEGSSVGSRQASKWDRIFRRETNKAFLGPQQERRSWKHRMWYQLIKTLIATRCHCFNWLGFRSRWEAGSMSDPHGFSICSLSSWESYWSNALDFPIYAMGISLVSIWPESWCDMYEQPKSCD